ncbi:MAG: hypothetical protein ACE5KZ_14730 [Candidatus Scalinduaceae bacterium]
MKHRLMLIIVTVFILLVICNISIPQTSSEIYTNKKYGISFNIPKGMKMYTVENPGPLSTLFSKGTLLKLVNPDFTDENIDVSVSGKSRVTDSDIRKTKSYLDSNPNLPMPGYRRVSVNFIKTGKQKDKMAVEHIYLMKGNISGKLRQVAFSYRGRGFFITCGTAVDRFDEANQQFFDTIFNSIIFE